MNTFEFTPQGPFDLLYQNQFFGGWPMVDESALVLTFPVEGWKTSAAVILRQTGAGMMVGEVHGAGDAGERAWRQALAALSLDIDGSAWPDLGQRDPVIGELQCTYRYLRPILFHSPFEAAAAFIIGHRISVKQARVMRQAMAHDIGDEIDVAGMKTYAFPRPQVLSELTGFKGLSSEKVDRLRGVARAALDGRLDRAALRSLPVDAALHTIRSLRGIGDFFAQGILHRGAGIVDDLTTDELSKKAVKSAYNLSAEPDQDAIIRTAEAWRPYRMWGLVLLHVWYRRDP